MKLLGHIPVGLTICGELCVAAPATTFDHNRTGPITIVPGSVAGDLLTEGGGAPVVGISFATIGLQPGDEIDALSYGDDTAIMGFHVLVFSVQAQNPINQVGFGGVGLELSTGTAPSNPGPGPNPPEAAGDLFMQVTAQFGGCTNIVAPAGFGYGAGGLTGDEADAGWSSPNNPGASDDLDAFDYTGPVGATGVYFSLAPNSPTLLANGWTPGDILYSSLAGAGSVQLATLSGAGPATDANLGIAGQDLNALNCVEQSPGVIAPGSVGSVPCAFFPPVSSHLVEFSVNGLFSYVTGCCPPFLVTVYASDVLTVSAPGSLGFVIGGGHLGLCTFANCGGSNNVNALEAFGPQGGGGVGGGTGGGLASTGSTFDHEHPPAATLSGQAGDLLTEGVPGPPLISIPMTILGLQPGDDIDAVSYGDDIVLRGHHNLIFSVDLQSLGLPGSGVDFERTSAPAAPEAHGDLFLQMIGFGNVQAPAPAGYQAGGFTGDEIDARWQPGTPGGKYDDLDAFDYSPALAGLTQGVYFSLKPGSPTLTQNFWSPGDILYSTLNGPGSVSLALLAPTATSGQAPATAANLGIAGFDLDAINCEANNGIIAAGRVGTTPTSGGGGTHLLEFSVARTTPPPVINPDDVLGVNGPGNRIVLTTGASLGLCSWPPVICDGGPDNINALEAVENCEEGEIDDDWDLYPPDSFIHGQGGWKGFDNDAFLSATVTAVEALSLPHAIEIDFDDHIVHEFCTPGTGVWSYQAWVYIPADFPSGGIAGAAAASFQMYSVYSDGGAKVEGAKIDINPDGELKIFDGDPFTFDTPYDTDKWKKIQILVDETDDWTQIYYDNALTAEYTWTGGVTGEGGGALDIAGVDLDAGGTGPLYYDDLRLEPLDGCGSIFEDFDNDGATRGQEHVQGTDSCNPDSDGDGHLDGMDNCPTEFNPTQQDDDEDGVGNACEEAPPCPADTNGDTTVDVNDLVAVITAWGPCPGGCPEDINGDMVVDVNDLVELIVQWGDC